MEIKFIGEDINSNKAKSYVQNIIEKEEIDVLFIDYHNAVINSKDLQSVFDNKLGKDSKYEETKQYFIGQKIYCDNISGIRDLSIFACQNNIRTIFCDAENDDIIAQYRGLPPWDCGIKGGGKLYKPDIEFDEYEYLALRNKWTAHLIAKKLLSSNYNKAVFLCKSNRLKDSVTEDEILNYGWPFGLSTKGVDGIFAVFNTQITQETIFID